MTTEPPKRRQININVTDAVYRNLVVMAKALGVSRTTYAGWLLEAAYAARCKNTGDAELQDVVGATLILHGQKQDAATIAKALRIGEVDVARIIDTWRARDRRSAA